MVPNIDALTGGWLDSTDLNLPNDTNKFLKEIQPGIHLLEGGISFENSRQLVEYFLTSPKFGDVSIQGFNSGGFNDQVGSRRTTLFNETLSNNLTSLIKDQIALIQEVETNQYTPTDAWQHTTNPTNEWVFKCVSPLLRFMVYSDGGQHYAHYDAAYIYPEDTDTRSLKSVVIYLSTNDTGATRFIDDNQSEIPTSERNHEDWSVEVSEDLNNITYKSLPITGNILIFDHRLCHDVDKFIPKDKNEKRIIIRTDLIYHKNDTRK